jgi:hypothetical protein
VTRRADEVLAELRSVAREIADRDRLAERRFELVEEARSLDPPVPMRDLAAALGMTDASLRVALHQRRKARAEGR